MLPLRPLRLTVISPVLLGVFLTLAGCATRSTPPLDPAGLAPGARLEEPLNLSDAKAAVHAYLDSGAYLREFAAASAEARGWIERRAAARRPGERLAVVLDIDETVLSNLPHMLEQDFGYVPRLWDEWVDQAAAPALEPMLEVYRAARAADVAVLFLTGRKAPRDRAGTEENLRRTGMGEWEALRFAEAGDAHLPTAAARKAAARAAWKAEGWTIIATIGDQYSDLEGGHAERAFKLPNPMYRIP
jgi:hypothetical protein